jgi:hypothetical protein
MTQRSAQNQKRTIELNQWRGSQRRRGIEGGYRMALRDTRKAAGEGSAGRRKPPQGSPELIHVDL